MLFCTRHQRQLLSHCFLLGGDGIRMSGATKHSFPSCHKGDSSHTTNITYPLFERFMHSSAEPRSYFYTPGLTLEFILILKVICQRLIEYFLLVIKYNMILIKWQLSIFLIAIDSTIPSKVTELTCCESDCIYHNNS